MLHFIDGFIPVDCFDLHFGSTFQKVDWIDEGLSIIHDILSEPVGHQSWEGPKERLENCMCDEYVVSQAIPEIEKERKGQGCTKFNFLDLFFAFEQ